jgi:hypothetical protein
MDERPSEFAGTCIITWPRPSGTGGVLAGWGVAITDAATGEQIFAVTGITVHLHADAKGLIWADLEMFADRDGKPLLSGTPILGPDGGEILTGVFPFLVSGMRVAGE